MIFRRVAAFVWMLAILSAVGYLGVRLASGVTLESNRARLTGVVSRKLQIVPVLTDIFSKG